MDKMDGASSFNHTPPSVAVEERPFKVVAFFEAEAAGDEIRVGRGEAAGGQARGDTEAGVEDFQNDARTPSRETAGRFAKIRDEPLRTGRGCGGETRDEHGELLGREAVEKEVRHQQIKIPCGHRPCERIGMDEFHIPLASLRTGTRQHFRTRIHTSDRRRRIRHAQCSQRATVSFAEREDAARCFRREASRAGALESVTRKQPFQPAIMWGDAIKAHAPL